MTTDKFGVYRVGDQKFYSKVQAIEAMTRTGIHLHWDFNDDVFARYDWTKEPELSLDQLYCMRAQQIRQRYDYIVIMYSGGPDSHNVLQSFLRNDIPVDEICQFWSVEAEKSYHTFFNEEVYRVAIPETQKILDEHPEIKHRVIDQSQLTFELFDKDDNRFDFFYKVNSMFSPNHLARSYFRDHVDDWKHIVDSGRTMCIVWGSDKPRIQTVDNRLCYRFIDLLDNCVSNRTIINNRPWENDELFYWAPDLPEMLIKQGHAIKKIIKASTAYSHGIVTHNTGLGLHLRDGKKYYMTKDWTDCAVYPHWDPQTFSVGKTPSIVFSRRDDWFFKDNNLNNNSRQYYLSGIEKLADIAGEYWTNHGGIANGIKNCWSKPYFLE